MGTLTEAFEQITKDRFGLETGSKLILAISGGLDSVVLLHLLVHSGYSPILAHVNFNLRGEESLRDEQYVRQLAQQFQLPLELYHPDTLLFCEQHQLSVQEAARTLRYQWFETLIEKHPASVLLTAHHADDSIETMVMNFFRGTGIHGLKGIPQKNGHIIRPLLSFTRQQLQDHASQHNLNWMEDSSNQSDKYTRNYFRNTLLPLIKEAYPGVQGNLQANLVRFQEAIQLYDEAVIRQKKRLMEVRGQEVYIPVLKLLHTQPLATLLFEIIRNYGFSSLQVEEVRSLCFSETGKWVASSTHRILRNRNWLIISPVLTETPSIFTIEKGLDQLQAQGFALKIRMLPAVPESIPTDPSIALLDARKIHYPLILRKWKAGDYFYPLGMRKKKKVARFLIDRKLSALQKEQTWVLESGKRIIWVVGQRIDERFKLTASSQMVLHLQQTQ